MIKSSAQTLVLNCRLLNFTSQIKNTNYPCFRHQVILLTSPSVRKYSDTTGQRNEESHIKKDDPSAWSTSASESEHEEEFQMKLKILESALNHVNSKGWSTDSLKAGASDLNLSDSIASLCTPYDLVEYFQRYSNHKLDKYLEGIDKKDKSLYNSMEYRLKQVVPFIDRYHQAMGLSLEPINIPRSLQVLRELSDTICIRGLGDTSTDLRWYTKRTGIISMYIATECCMVQDKSEGFQDTWKFLERRVKDYESFQKAGTDAFPVLESGVITILNILGMNKRR